MRSDLEKKICEHYRVPGVQIVMQGSYGTLKTIASALAHERQVVLIHDSGGAAQVLAEIIEPLLDREKELTREEMFRKREVKKRIDEYSVENEKSLALMQMLREYKKATKEGAWPEVLEAQAAVAQATQTPTEEAAEAKSERTRCGRRSRTFVCTPS